MRQRLLIVITLVVVVVILVLLNAATYVKVEPQADSEAAPDRSTFNAGATGTRALFDFLHESGHDVVRWRESTDGLLSFSGPKPATVVIIGEVRVPFSTTEKKELMHWVEEGGRLVLIDRMPDPKLLPDSGRWAIRTQVTNVPWYDVDPTNFEQMTHDVKAIAPSQPTLLARDIESVLPSRFAGAITIAPRVAPEKKKANSNDNSSAGSGNEEDEEEFEPSPEPTQSAAGGNNPPPISPAPVVSFAGDHGSILIDYPHGKGRIVLLADPYIVANNGINRADNLQLAVNVVVGSGGLVAFDEFHQGRAATQNALIQYFAGTPILAICAQLGLIGLAIVWSRGTRFARPLPLPQVDRRSSLEFVASMAELQQRAKAHDLALENIYTRVRRVLVRYAGLNQAAGRAQIAARVAARAKLNQKQLESLMRSCEDIINGAPTNGRETLRLAKRLREIEASLGLQGRARDAKQNEMRT
ncbi:MAG TPA: DUF4350 domain-containing protein [Pyrinomonadaceae bacterium]|nr:DUF4350 domain-containing protein [Pyrinomonadaceae bacterium]